MKIIPTSPTDWDNHLVATGGHFLQSWAWGDFQEALGNKIWRLAVEDNGHTVAELLIIKLSLGFGQSLLYSPRGQIIDKQQPLATAQAAADMLLTEIKKIAEAEQTICFRIDPPTTVTEITADRFYASRGFVKNPKGSQPKHSSILDLKISLEQLENRMKPKTRYNIHLAEKHNITVSVSDQASDFQNFLSLIHSTSGRQNFVAHSDRYYKTQYQVLHQAGIQNLWIARQQDKVLAAILVNSFGQTATYVHGASDNRYRELMAPHLLQFRAIEAAQKSGLRYYDFWGIHPDPNHAWAGFTRFKRGFSGNEVEYIGTLELPTRPLLYKLYRLISRLR
jgi:lipid II:glycine glycyltransferase (peptidoglycan interpeptide bridge formation enzyme)